MEAVVVIGFRVVLREEEVFLTLMEGILKFWEETRLRRNKYQVMVTLKGRFNG